MDKGEPQGPITVDQSRMMGGIEDINKAINDARENVAAVDTLVDLLKGIDEINSMHTMLEQTVRYLEKLALQHENNEVRQSAAQKLDYLKKELLDKIRQNPQDAHLIAILYNWLMDQVPPSMVE